MLIQVFDFIFVLHEALCAAVMVDIVITELVNTNANNTFDKLCILNC